jgi:uncharacterized protein YndB with AHSA1/START domain
MSTKSDDLANTTSREIVMSWRFHAPRELVFESYTAPEHVPHWWGPRGCTITIPEMDARAGGVWRFLFHLPDGSTHLERIEYLEVLKPERLVFLHGEERDGALAGAFHVNINFTQRGAETEVVSRMVFDTVEEREATVNFGAIELGNQTLDRFSEYLAATQAAKTAAEG